MSIKTYLTVAWLGVSGWGCPSKTSPAPKGSEIDAARSKSGDLKRKIPSLSQPTVAEDGSEAYGAPLTAKGEALAIGEILKNPEPYKDRRVFVSGIVRNVCRKKGCWMELAMDPHKDTAGCRITFQNYAFFVRKDAQGYRAKVEGLLSVKTLSKDRVEHLEAEGAHFASKQPDGNAHELLIVATGVELKAVH